MDTITVTEFAVENIRRMQAAMEAHDTGLRFGLSGGGCSGYRYVLELEDGAEADDVVFEHHGLSVFVKTEHMEKLKNSVIDWKDSLMESGFAIENPQAKRPCGCGESVDF